VVAEIDDTGHGIPETSWRRSSSLSFTTKPTGRGTGLGLSVVRTIVDLHGATIDVRNLHEAGVRVTLMFQSDMNKKRLLIVDDESASPGSSS